MFENSEAFGSFSVGDVSEAGRFYGETLGLEVSEMSEPMSMLVLHIAGGRDVMVYAKPDHAPASFTVLNFPVEDINRVVDGLIERGVHIERYRDLNQDDRGILQGEGPPIAWFRDPAGNFLSVIQQD